MQETFKFGELVRLIPEILRYISLPEPMAVNDIDTPAKRRNILCVPVRPKTDFIANGSAMYAGISQVLMMIAVT